MSDTYTRIYLPGSTAGGELMNGRKTKEAAIAHFKETGERLLAEGLAIMAAGDAQL